MDALQIAEQVVGWLRPDGPHTLAEQTRGWGAAEWAEARHAALVHGVAPLLAARLEATPAWLALDPGLRAYCLEQRRLNGLRAAALGADLAAILHATARAGIAVLPLKGAVLIEQFYAEPALRPMADIDLLVRPAQGEALHQVLRELGYGLAEETPRHRAYHRGEPSIASWDGEHPDNPRGVEVHMAVGERLRAISYTITASLWAGARAGLCAGAPCLLPATGDLLHHLLIHAAHSMINRRLRLVQLYDLALVAPLVSPTVWQTLVAGAVHARETRLLYAPLVLAERVFGALAPAPARAALATSTPAPLRRLLHDLTPSQVSLCNRQEATPGFKLAWYHPGPEWIGALLRVAVPAPAELRQRYPATAGGLPGAYLRHASHTAGWALRLATGRQRRTGEHPQNTQITRIASGASAGVVAGEAPAAAREMGRKSA